MDAGRTELGGVLIASKWPRINRRVQGAPMAERAVLLKNRASILGRR